MHLPAGSTAKPRILVVEDEVMIALLIADTLESNGFEVVGPCQTVSQALAKLGIQGCCDAVVLDANLRNESSVPVAQELVKLAIPFVVATGYNLSQLPAELAAAPVLAKPMKSEDLILHLHRVLSIG